MPKPRRRSRNLVKRGGNWYLRIQVDGRDIRRSVGPNLREARRLLAFEKSRIRAEQFETGRRARHPEPGDVTVKEFCERWLREYVELNRAEKNRKNARSRMDRLVLPNIGRIRLCELTRSNLAELRLALETRSGLSPRSVHHVLADVRCMLRYAVEIDLIRKSPFTARTLMPKISAIIPRDLSDDQVDKIVAAAAPNQEFAIRLALLTGMRWGELRRLRWDSVRWHEPAHLELELTKTRRVRRVPLSPEAVTLLRGEWERVRGEKRPSVHVLRITGVNPGAWVRYIRKRSGVTWNFHQLRHTFARRWIESGGGLEVLARILGHSTVRMTEQYAHLSDRYVMEEAQRIGLTVGRKPAQGGQ